MALHTEILNPMPEEQHGDVGAETRLTPRVFIVARF